MAESSQRLVRIFADTLNPDGGIRARAEHDLAGILDEAGTTIYNGHERWLMGVDIVESILQVFTTYQIASIRQISLFCSEHESPADESTVLESHFRSTSQTTGQRLARSLRRL